MKDLLHKLFQHNIRIDVIDDQIELSIPEGFDGTDIILEIKENKQELITFIKDAKEQESFFNIKPAPEQDSYALSSAQKRLYFLQEMEPESTAYNMPQAIPFKMNLEPEKIQEVFDKLLDRHESLRTSFHLLDGVPRQKIARETHIQLSYHEARGEKVQEIISNFTQPFDLSKGPMIRVGLINQPGDATSSDGIKSILMIDMHHIITDGISEKILVRDVLALYEGKKLSPLKLQYKDFAEWQQSEDQQRKLEKQKSYWLRQFEGDLPSLPLPTDFPRTANQSLNSGQYILELGPALTSKFQSLAHKTGSTLYTLVLSMCNVWLMKLARQTDVVIGSPTGGRNHSDLEDIIGMFVNTLALRNYPSEEKTFVSFLAEVGGNFLEAIENQNYQFEDLVNELNISRDLSRNPLFDVLLNANEPYEGLLPSAQQEDHEAYPSEDLSKFDISIFADFNLRNFKLSFLYKEDLFTHETIEQYASYFKNIATVIADTPDIHIKDIDLLGEAENKRLNQYLKQDLKEENITSIQAKLQQHLTPTNTQTAIEYRGKKYSYGDVDVHATQIANQITEANISPGSFIGVLYEDRFKLITTILGILKARCAFVPLNKTFPNKKIVSLISHTNLEHIYSDLHQEDLLPYSIFTPEVKWYNVDRLDTGENHVLNQVHNYQLADPIYLYFTSGSTGEPKGIIGQNQGLSHFVSWEISTMNIDDKFRISQLIPPSFDAFLRDVFVTFCAGATLCIPPNETALILDQLGEWLEENQINLIHTVPSVFRVLNVSDLEKTSFPHLKHILMAGEEIHPYELRNWFEQIGERIRLYNLYGATEMTMFRSCHPIGASDVNRRKIPLGKAISNSQLFILDDQLKNCGPLIVGEIYLRSPYRTLGYLNQSLHAQSFIQNPHTNDPEDLLYKTGDLGRQLLGGNYEYWGRKDDQVKINGIRIELGEINTLLLKFAGISKSVAIVKKDEHGKSLCCAYFVSSEKVDVIELRNYLQSELPLNMVPAFLCQIDAIPLTTNGKINKKALPAPVHDSGESYVEPRTELEKHLAEIWSTILNIEKIGVKDNFFFIGGDSLKSMQIVATLKSEGYNVSIKDLFKSQTIESMASVLDTKGKEGNSKQIKEAEKRRYYPLSSAQKRIYLDHMIMKDSHSLNMYDEFEVPKEYDIEKLTHVFQKIVDRHESLRTSFHTLNNIPVQVIHDQVNMEIIDLSSKKIPGSTLTYNRSFDLSVAPLLRVGLIEKENSNILIVDIHHIISDGLSNTVLRKEFNQIIHGVEPASLKLQYKDYAVWQHHKLNSEGIKQQESYWLHEFRGNLPKLKLLSDLPNPNPMSQKGASITFQVGEEIHRKLSEISQTYTISMFSMLMAIQSIVFQKISNQEDIIVGFPTTGRNHAHLENIIGMFINTIALRLFPMKSTSFKDFILEVSASLTEALDNQDYQFDMLIEKLKLKREGWKNPLFSVIMMMQNHLKKAEGDKDLENNGSVIGEREGIAIVNDLFFRFSESSNNIIVNIQYNTGLYSRDFIIKMFEFFKETIIAASQDEEIKIGDIQLSHSLQEARVMELDSGFDF